MESPNNRLIDLLTQDLQLELPFENGDLIPPYDEAAPFDEQFKNTYAALRRSIQLKERLNSLINAYYIGKLLNSLETKAQQFRYKQKLTNHYTRMSENVFDIFEHQPIKILGTFYITAQIARKINRSQVKQLREIVQGLLDQNSL